MKRHSLSIVMRGLFFSLFLMGLTGCAKQLPQPRFSIYHPVSPYQRSLIARMHQQGMVVIKQGDLLKVIIPTDKFFRLQTTMLKPGKKHALVLAGRFVKNYAAGYRNPVIEVDGYTDKVFGPTVRRTLSQQYAEVVASYLWDAGIVRSRIRVRGLGAEHSVASNRYPSGTAFNRRVEIVVNFN